MPGLNGTGPRGLGQGTGWGRGYCGKGMRRAGGWGWRRFFSPKNELAALADEEKMLEEELAALREEKAALNNRKK